MTKMDDITAPSHLIGKWIRAQAHAMNALNCLAVVWLDQSLQMQVQDILIGMVKHTEVSIPNNSLRWQAVQLLHLLSHCCKHMMPTWFWLATG